MKRLWVATIQVAVFADDEASACDIISESMREATGGPAMPDWQYATFGGQRLGPSHQRDMADGVMFGEGELFQLA